MPCATQENRLQRHLAAKFGVSVLISKTVRYTRKKSITKLFSIIELVREDTFHTSDLRNVWFQHDGAPPHKESSIQQYIWDTFQQQVIGYGGCVEWPPRSPDLNTLDFLLWGYIKQRVYATPPPTLQELRNRITDACASVSPAMLYNVQREVQSHVQMCIVAEGHHFEHGI
ncbi:hypothetical protein AVEN_267673-1 [Araneus ventricosus]|uniref:Tc1-like transposase DDE domain-containing protein n=1 Tax=Araneus ventricosus TaxID=182803 RepID=A0A4Y2U0H7_ARAVE|nr:hypothetical protein AVEN_267673-1 [Araneus ventricosus]